jgi:hypothetical protein
MKLPHAQLDLETALAEFDVWITPSTGEIRDTGRFRSEMEAVVVVFELLSGATNGFADPRDCDPAAIADTISAAIANKSRESAHSILSHLASVLFLVTGKSDNNAKCQLPLHLRDIAGWDAFPGVRRRKGKVTLVRRKIPRELKAGKYMKAVVDLVDHAEERHRLLREFTRFVLSDGDYVSQLWSVGRSYCMLKEFDKHKSLLTPLVVFQVRGSVSASGGHDPEELLRDRLREWGLEDEVDFNLSDVVIAEERASGGRKKTRAYDFVLPFDVPTWEQRVFVQCQFYAGDSGSVSHKNVDQTSTSRAKVRSRFSKPMFVEYVDGAGYFSSLNGDLKNLLSMDDTASFFQIRSAAIRLRREFQRIGFLCPIDVEQAVLRSDRTDAGVKKILRQDGYALKEIHRSLKACKERKLLNRRKSRWSIVADRRAIVRRYLLLDVAACLGAPPDPEEKKLVGALLVPGYGPFHGIKIDALAKRAVEIAPTCKKDWSSPETILEDIRWLCEQGIAMSC